MNTLFKKDPIEYFENIPIFSNRNEDYIQNYEKISKDHLNAIENGIENPFIHTELWNQMEEGTVSLALKYIHSYIQETGSKKIRILDVGVGLGRLIDKIKTNYSGDTEIEYWGIDISISYLIEANKKGINVVFSKIEDFPFYDEIFDIVLCTDVLEHVLDLNLALKNIKNVLKKGGYLIIRVPNKEDLNPYLASDYPYYYVHLRSFDKASLSLLLTRILDLKLIEFTNGAFYPNDNLLKYKLPFKLYYCIIHFLKKILSKINEHYYLKFLEYFYEPIEINCVVRKK